MQRQFTVLNEADSEAAEILIYDRIGKETGQGIDGKEFKAALDDIPTDRDILCRINSPGGNVWDAFAMYNTLSERRQRVICQVDGVAASAASVVACAGRLTRAPANAMVMIHLPSISAWGNASDLRREAQKLDAHTDILSTIYAEKTGRPAAEIVAAMEKESWFTGPEAKDFGLVDEVTEPQEAITALAGGFDFSKFSKTPELLAVQGNFALKRSGFNDPGLSDEEAEAAMVRIYDHMRAIEWLKNFHQEMEDERKCRR